MRDELKQHFARKMALALSEKVPGSETPAGSYLIRHLLTDDQARRLVDVISEMISVSLEPGAS